MNIYTCIYTYIIVHRYVLEYMFLKVYILEIYMCIYTFSESILLKIPYKNN